MTVRVWIRTAGLRGGRYQRAAKVDDDDFFAAGPASSLREFSSAHVHDDDPDAIPFYPGAPDGDRDVLLQSPADELEGEQTVVGVAEFDEGELQRI